MLTRRVMSTASTAAALSCQRRFDHDRWYGHALELDVHNYRFTGEPPSWMKNRERTAEETEFAKSVLPHIDFASSYECLLFDADRLNPHLNRKEFGNEVRIRLEKQAATVARARQLVADKTYAADPALEDQMIARVFDEEHVQAEMKYVKCIRANELAEDNRLDILPGGSANSLREKTRWNVNIELHPADRAEIAIRLTAWLPEKYHIVYFDDFQTVAANNATARAEMKSVLTEIGAKMKAEAEALGFEKDLSETLSELSHEVDPTAHITPAAIAYTNSLDELEKWSREVHEYNGDDRIIAIYQRAQAITKDAAHAKLLEKLVSWRKLATKN